MSSKRKADLGIQPPPKPADTCFFHSGRLRLAKQTESDSSEPSCKDATAKQGTMPPADQWVADRNRDWRRSSTLRGPDPSRLRDESCHIQAVRWRSVFGYRPTNRRCRWTVCCSPGLPRPGIRQAAGRVCPKWWRVRY